MLMWKYKFVQLSSQTGRVYWIYSYFSQDLKKKCIYAYAYEHDDEKNNCSSLLSIDKDKCIS